MDEINKKSIVQSAVKSKIFQDKWFALYTKSRSEKKVYKELLDNEIEAYLPLHTVIKQWSDRKKKIKEPMIRSYVFVKANEKKHNTILGINGAVRFIRFDGKPASIPEWQIDSMRKMVDNRLPHYYTSQHLKKGEQVTINSGPLTGVEGEVIRESKGKQKVIIRIGNIGYSLVIESPVTFVEKCIINHT